MDLTLLAPDVQERILFAEAVDGQDPMSERGLREVTCSMGWARQRERFGRRILRQGRRLPSA
jgi:hypothetical protein